MSVNSSSLSNSSLASVHLPFSHSTVSLSISIAFSITRMCLLIPLSSLILHMGHRQWRQQHYLKTVSHSDIFTYQAAVLELMWGLGTLFYLCGICCNLPYMASAGTWLSSVVLSGETFFHLLTCVERYLAVVHPITYLGLRNVRGVRIRNISIGCAWLLSFVWSTILTVNSESVSVGPFLCFLVFSLSVVSFCGLSVLYVLIYPRAGQQGTDREWANQSKQRISVTIMAITGVLWFWFSGVIISFSLGLSPLLSDSVHKVIKTCALWFSLPSSLVLPLLYLNKERKLSCCCCSVG